MYNVRGGKIINFPDLSIGDLKPELPIIQGGMAVKISMADLAAAVAEEGGIGVIAATGLSVDELRSEIEKARSKTEGIIGVNIMFAASEFSDLLQEAISAGIDLVISGAGFSRDMFSVGRKADVPIVPIVSSARLAKLSEKLGAAAVVAEGENAGGHLGGEDNSSKILKEIKNKISIPVISAGNIVTPAEVKDAFDRGADGVQMGTRFLASRESDTAEYFMKLCKQADSDDIVKIMSSVGLPARAIKTEMVEKIMKNEAPPPENCVNCLKKCSKKFCVRKALLAGRAGNKKEGLFFTGPGLEKIDRILSVRQIFSELKKF